MVRTVIQTGITKPKHSVSGPYRRVARRIGIVIHAGDPDEEGQL